MEKSHHYGLTVTWTGNTGEGTASYRAYARNHVVSAPGKPDLMGSSDPVFRGDQARYNPEELLVAALSACHMLAYLHLCAVNRVVVTAYTDEATGVMNEAPDGTGRFTEVILHPRVIVMETAMVAKANSLHDEAHRHCFIAASVNFPVSHQPRCRAAENPEG